MDKEGNHFKRAYHLKEVLRDKWKTLVVSPVLAVFGFLEFEHFPDIYNTYWTTQLQTSLLSFSGVVLGLLIVALSFVYSFLWDVGDTDEFKANSLLSGISTMMIQTVFIVILNIFSYFVRYDIWGRAAVGLEIFILPTFFISLIYVVSLLPGSPIYDIFRRVKREYKKYRFK